jgi:hypothetical protein
MKGNSLRLIVLIVAFISIMFIMRKGVRMTRGMRNNNPFNMNRTLTQWLGEVEGSDERFSSFSTLEYGVRAGLINLYNGYFSRFMTVRQIVMKYSPPQDNKSKDDPDGMKSVEAYIKTITRRSGVDEGSVPGKDKWLSVAEAMLYQENGMVVKSVYELVRICIKFNLVNYM